VKDLGERQAIPFTALSSARGSALFGGNSISIYSQRASRFPFLALAGHSGRFRATLMQLRRHFLSEDDRQYLQYRDAFIAREQMSLELVSLFR
jgi:hypothetical protein